MLKKVIRITSAVICLAVFCFSLFKIITYFTQRKQANNFYEKVISNAVTVTNDDTQTDEINPSTSTETSQILKVDFDLLKKEYKDITGWIYIPNTKINYPVVKSKDNAEYLKTMPNGKSNPAGSIFNDFRNGEFGQDRNYIIYGHNMKNDSMFGSLSEYKKQSFYEQHPIIYYMAPEKEYKLQVFAGFVTNADSDCYITHHTEETLAEYMKNAKQKSNFKTGVEYNTGDNIVTLSTCSSDYKDARYVLIAIVR